MLFVSHQSHLLLGNAWEVFKNIGDKIFWWEIFVDKA
jgi:hypothetical protein